MWRALHHPNVLPLLGVTMTETHLVMVSEWMDNESIKQFVQRKSDMDQLGLVCFLLKLLSSLVTDNHMIVVAERHC